MNLDSLTAFPVGFQKPAGDISPIHHLTKFHSLKVSHDPLGN